MGDPFVLVPMLIAIAVLVALVGYFVFLLAFDFCLALVQACRE